MIYLSSFHFPREEDESSFRFGLKRTCYDSIYPFFVLSERKLMEIYFRPITILYGGNGSGKSTALNVIAEKLKLRRETPFNRSPFFEQYVDLCSYSEDEPIPPASRIITSDDVFDFMLSLRAICEGVDFHREKLFDEYYELKNKRNFKLRSMDDYEDLKRINDARSKTQSRYVRAYNPATPREHSNGESAEQYFTSRIAMDSLCLLDEPENSLSPENQLKLAGFLEESVRYCGCQLIISTHSPFLLAMNDARIINLDDNSREARWTELPNVRAYYEFFQRYQKDFTN